MIRFDNVDKVYADGTTAVDQLSLEVADGMLTVFVGSSGCGKTTALRMINRMVEPSSGAVTVNGTDVSTVNPVKLRLGIGYVIQNAGLMPHQRVIDNVAAVPVLKGQSRRAARKAAYEVLERVGLNPKVASRYPAQLSGGEQQRVGLARALAADPPILLMDEAFSAVDLVVRHDLQNEILRLQSVYTRPSFSSRTTSTRRSNSVRWWRCSRRAVGCSNVTSPPGCWPARPMSSCRNSLVWAVATGCCNSSMGRGSSCMTSSGSV